jgi:hypothetical protein
MSNFIVERYIDTELCDQIVKNFNESDPSWTNSTRGYWLMSSDRMNQELMIQYKEEIYKHLYFYKEVFPDAFEGFASLRLTEPFNVQRYEPNQFYSRWHCENNGHQAFQTRVLAFMTYLNTVDDGGETEFMYQDMKTRVRKGKTLIWPAYFTHTHRGIPSPTQNKYIITGWVEVAPWEDIDLDESDEDFYKKLDAVDTVSRFL